MTTIKIWGDFACPFCCIGETRLEQVIEKLNLAASDVKIEFKAYELDVDAPAEPVETMQQHFMKEHSLTAEEAMAQMHHISKLALRIGLRYNLEGVKVCSTFDAHRLMKYCTANYEQEMLVKLNFALFKANFTDNLMLSDRGVLAEVASGVGMDGGKVAEFLVTEEYASEVRGDEAEAEASNLEFIPYMLFENGEVLQGVMSNGALKDAIRGLVGGF